jgi:hypothetical protein
MDVTKPLDVIPALAIKEFNESKKDRTRSKTRRKELNMLKGSCHIINSKEKVN